MRFSRVITVACVAAAVAGLTASEAGARRIWRVAGYSLRFEESVRGGHPVCDPQFSYPTGYDIAGEAVTLTMRGLEAVSIPARGGGPITRIDPFGGTTTLGRRVSRQLANCTDGSRKESACSDTRTVSIGSQEAFSTGSFRLSTNRFRKLVRVRVTGFGFEPEVLECASDPEPGFFLGPPVPLNQPVLMRATLPLKRFARKTTTISLSRTLRAPPDAGASGIPQGTARITVRIVLKRSSAN